MMRGVMGQQKLNWGAFNHASHAPQLHVHVRSCNYYVYTLYIHVVGTLVSIKSYRTIVICMRLELA